VEAMSLYHHVPSKASLITLMADRTLAAVTVGDRQGTWTQEIVDLLVQTFLAAIENPAVLPVLAAEPLHPGTLPAARGTGGPSLGLLEQVLEQLERGHLPADVQVHAFRGLIGVTTGFIAGQVGGLLPAPTTTDQPTTDDQQRRAAAAPLLTSITPALKVQDPAAGLRFTLELYVAGLQQLATSPAN
jgi:AcrR family transcriptional regulator